MFQRLMPVPPDTDPCKGCNCNKIAILRNKIAILARKIAILDDKIVILQRKIGIFVDKMSIFLRKIDILLSFLPGNRHFPGKNKRIPLCPL